MRIWNVLVGLGQGLITLGLCPITGHDYEVIVREPHTLPSGEIVERGVFRMQCRLCGRKTPGWAIQQPPPKKGDR